MARHWKTVVDLIVLDLVNTIKVVPLVGIRLVL